MANICIVDMQVTGSEGSILEFEKILYAKYNYEKNEFSYKPHLFRIFGIYSDDEIEKIGGLLYTKHYYFECAWNAEICLMDTPKSYYDIYKDVFNPFYGTNIIKESIRLNLDIELWSQECSFEEHIHVRQGKILINECYDYEDIYIADYDNYNDYLNSDAYYEDTKITKEIFDNAKEAGEDIAEYHEALNAGEFELYQDCYYDPFKEKKVMCEIIKKQ